MSYKRVLDRLLENEHWLIRAAVAEQGYGLDKLVNDDSYWVRAEVARQGYGLDILIKDEEEYVRSMVQECIDSPVFERRKLSYQEMLVNLLKSDYWQVRAALAEQGYGLDVLIKDEDFYVRKIANAAITAIGAAAYVSWKNAHKSEIQK